MLNIQYYTPERFPLTPENQQQWTASYMQYPSLWEHFHDINTLAPYADFSSVSKESLETFLIDIFQRPLDKIPSWLTPVLKTYFTYEEQLCINPHLSRQASIPHFDMANIDLFDYLQQSHHLGLHLDGSYLQVLAQYFTTHTVNSSNQWLLLQITKLNNLSKLEDVFAQHPILFQRIVSTTSRSFWHRTMKDDLLLNFLSGTQPHATYISLNFLKSPANIFPERIFQLHERLSEIQPHETASLHWFQKQHSKERPVLESLLRHHPASLIGSLLCERYPDIAAIFDAQSEHFAHDMMHYLYNEPVMMTETEIYCGP